MHHLLNILDHASSTVEALVFAGVLILCWNIEALAGLTTNYKKWRHAFLNSSFIFTNMPLQFLLGLAFIQAIRWTSLHSFGILFYLPSHHPYLYFIISFCLLDLGEYVYHLLMHKIRRLWMFHMVHHTDLVVDVSTTLREHPGENLIRNCFTLLWVFISGISFPALLIRQLIQVISNIFSHINYRLPQKLDNIVGLAFITPNLHHVHHHYLQPYTDTNYGDVLSIWDHLFGTFSRLPSDRVTFGVEHYMEEEKNAQIGSLIRMPFRK
jgi:sterol desaturase/sphingolipid hydroxylase (fatty acid hydroxylase superfamily)